MRQIEIDTVHAMRNARKVLDSGNDHSFSWHKQNMQVNTDVLSNCVRVFLHGNCIARLFKDHLAVTLSGWNTVTTRSRVNAFINSFCNGYFYGIFQKNFEPYFTDNGKPRRIDSNEFISIPLYPL